MLLELDSDNSFTFGLTLGSLAFDGAIFVSLEGTVFTSGDNPKVGLIIATTFRKGSLVVYVFTITLVG